MAASLSRWLKSAVRRISADGYDGCDQVFCRGSKVQILRFLPHEANVRRNEAVSQEPELWAIVADRDHSILVHFSAACVKWFDSTHTRPLISLRGSIIQLRSYRPQVSSRAAQVFAQGSASSTSGPFAQRSHSSYRVYLEIETLHLWGSINALTFFDSVDLQSSLIKEASVNSDSNGRAFVRWFGTAASAAYREGVFERARRTERRLSAESVQPVTPHERRPLTAKQIRSEREEDVVHLQKEGGADEFGLEGAAALAFERHEKEGPEKNEALMSDASSRFMLIGEGGGEDHGLSEWRQVGDVQ